MATQFEKFKLWIFPSLASLVGLLILNIASEIRTDMKFLMSQTLSDHVRINNLERVVYGEGLSKLQSLPPALPERVPADVYDSVAIIPDNRSLVRNTAKKKDI